MVCPCGADWRVEGVDMRKAVIRSVLNPVSMNFETVLNGVGNGTLTFPIRDVAIRDVWPKLTLIYIMFRNEPVYAGIVEAFESNTENGTTRVGLKSVENYLFGRRIRQTFAFESVEQTVIARDLVDAVAPTAFLKAEALQSTRLRDRIYEDFDRTDLGQAISNLTGVLGGPDWEMTYRRTLSGMRVATIRFADRVGTDRNVVLSSTRGVAATLSVDGSAVANTVDAKGHGEDEDTLYATAVDDDSPYPPYDAVTNHTTVKQLSTLQEHADGDLDDRREPDAVPGIKVVGPDPPPAMLRLGDDVRVEVDHGAATYVGDARILGIAYRVAVDSPVARTLSLDPAGRASQTVLNQQPSDPCPDCPPAVTSP